MHFKILKSFLSGYIFNKKKFNNKEIPDMKYLYIVQIQALCFRSSSKLALEQSFVWI